MWHRLFQRRSRLKALGEPPAKTRHWKGKRTAMQVVADPAAVLQTCLSWTHPLLREGKGQDDTALCLGDFSSSPLGHGRSQTATSRAAQLPPISANMNSKRSLNRCFGGREDLPSPQRLAQLQMIFVSKLSVIPHAGRSAVLLSPVMP